MNDLQKWIKNCTIRYNSQVDEINKIQVPFENNGMNVQLNKLILNLINEKTLFELFKNHPKYNSIEWRSKNQYDVIDWYIVELDYHIEGKCRIGNHYSHLIEKKKFEELKKHPNSFYVSTNENGIFMWDVHHQYAFQDIFWRMEMLPETTKFNNIKKVKKEVGYLNPAYAIDLTKELLYIYLK